jgi:hypothetical protein
VAPAPRSAPRSKLSASPTTGTEPDDRPDPSACPAVRSARDHLAHGDYAGAVVEAYLTAYAQTVRSFGLDVPVAQTDREFLGNALRPDMGPLPRFLPELYALYEPVRFGAVRTGDSAPLLAALEHLYGETALARAYDPGFQPGSADPVSAPAGRPRASPEAR